MADSSLNKGLCLLKMGQNWKLLITEAYHKVQVMDPWYYITGVQISPATNTSTTTFRTIGAVNQLSVFQRKIVYLEFDSYRTYLPRFGMCSSVPTICKGGHIGLLSKPIFLY
jgi:hypothetical protein